MGWRIEHAEHDAGEEAVVLALRLGPLFRLRLSLAATGSSNRTVRTELELTRQGKPTNRHLQQPAPDASLMCFLERRGKAVCEA